MKRTILLAALILAAAISLTGCRSHKVAITAHRGFWKSEAVANAPNSLASLGEAQANGFWGSEFDVNMTADGRLVVLHGPMIQTVNAQASPAAALDTLVLENGEPVPTLDSYLSLGAKSKCVLVFEIKAHQTAERSVEVTKACVEALKAHGLFDPERGIFISFSYDACKWIAANAPKFTNQYLGGDKSPSQLHEDSINGLDYHFSVLQKNPGWIEEAHALGMSVNVWTVNDAAIMQEMIEAGVDCITTDEPLLCREILGKKERR